MKQFEQEKETEVEKELGEKIALPEVKRGWNEWAGAGLTDTRYLDKVAKAEKFKREKIEEMK